VTDETVKQEKHKRRKKEQKQNNLFQIILIYLYLSGLIISFAFFVLSVILSILEYYSFIKLPGFIFGLKSSYFYSLPAAVISIIISVIFFQILRKNPKIYSAFPYLRQIRHKRIITLG